MILKRTGAGPQNLKLQTQKNVASYKHCSRGCS